MARRRSLSMETAKKVTSENESIPTVSERNKMFATKSATENREFAEWFIKRLLECNYTTLFLSIDILRLQWICKKIFEEQGRLVEVNGPIRVCGDLHGQYPDLIRMFAMTGFPPDSNYMFLGDYVDRGTHSLEVILLLLCYKARYPNNFFMLRGNHEMRNVNMYYGFREEIHSRRPNNAEDVYDGFITMMDVMPLTGLIGGRILCMHGGISPRLNSLEDLRKAKTPFCADSNCLESDILWSDPSYLSGWTSNPRGSSVCYGADVVKAMCEKLDIDMILRGHQVVQDGYDFFADKRLVTIFSAPYYTGTFSNSAAVCKITAGLEVSFEVLKPVVIAAEKHDDRHEEQSELTEHKSLAMSKETIEKTI